MNTGTRGIIYCQPKWFLMHSLPTQLDVSKDLKRKTGFYPCQRLIEGSGKNTWDIGVLRYTPPNKKKLKKVHVPGKIVAYFFLFGIDSCMSEKDLKIPRVEKNILKRAN